MVPWWISRNILLTFLVGLLTIHLQGVEATMNRTLRDTCQGTNAGMSSNKITNSDEPENKLRFLQNRFGGCQYVDGNLEIVGLDSEALYNADLSFLNSIKEVTGYVLIANVYVQNLTLENLTIIRGDKLFQSPSSGGMPDGGQHEANDRGSSGYALFVSLNYKKLSDSIGMRLLGLRSLTEISKGDVFFENNNLLCYATSDIYWSDIFTNTSSQKVSFIHDSVRSPTPCKPDCHDTCAATVPQRNMLTGVVEQVSGKYCWGPGPKNCQRMNKVTCAKQCNGRCYGPEVTQCCNIECAGGCNGPLKTDCWGCKNFYNDGGCVEMCPNAQFYDNTKFTHVANPNRKFAFGRLCLSACPENFLEHAGGCVKSCPPNFIAKPKRGGNEELKICVPCDGPCPKPCKLDWPGGSDFLNSDNIKDLKDCTKIDGHLRIFDITLTGDSWNNISALSLEDLDQLKSIREISDYLMIHHLENVTNFSFLSNLETILGRTPSSLGNALSIINNPDVQYLGLNSLKKVYGGHIFVQQNPKLCYLEGMRWRKLFLSTGTRNQKSFVDGNQNNSGVCVPQSMTCHPECKNGCWGPGSHMCLSCKNYKYSNECLSDCDRPMIYGKLGSSRCLDCDPECKSLCTGKGSDKCDACRNYKDGPFCVEACPKDDDRKIYKYGDDSKLCQPCHANCIRGCNGPANTVGLNGCDSCLMSIANDTEDGIVRCLNETEKCPSGYFGSRNPPQALSHLKGNTVCLRCDPLFSLDIRIDISTVTCPETTPVTNPSENILSNTPTSRTNTMATVTTVAGISLIAATSVIATACYKIKSRRKHYERPDDKVDEMEHDWYRSLEPATAVKLKEIHINLNRLCFNTGNVLGEGYFANIYLGELQRDDSGDNQRRVSQVAVKVLKDVRDIERDNLANKLVNEALLLSGFSHENVLNTLGICIPQRGQLCVVLPYMAHGDLRRFVKNKDMKLSIGDLMSLAQHVAKGMEYLSSNLFIHRDLAARNCLVGIDYTVKIADFGLSRDIYKKGYYMQLNLTSVPLPVKWTALEGLKDGTFTSFSDVWSFGVLVWELFTRGGEPYADVNIWEMKSYLEQGRRLEAPQDTPPDIYELMTTCWEVQPDRRPTFKEIVEYLDKSLGSRE